MEVGLNEVTITVINGVTTYYQILKIEKADILRYIYVCVCACIAITYVRQTPSYLLRELILHLRSQIAKDPSLEPETTRSVGKLMLKDHIFLRQKKKGFKKSLPEFVG